MQTHASLEALGWDSFFIEQWHALGRTDLVPARVIGEERSLWRIVTSGQLELWGELAGKLRFETQGARPAVGDWVAVAPRFGEGRATIQHVFHRRTCLQRKAAGGPNAEQILATNVDTAFVVSSLNGDLNPRRLERYLALVWESGARAVVVLTKADLAEDAAEKAEEIRLLGAPVHAISAVVGLGLAELDHYLSPGQTVVLLGSSGVGKSTLTNCLLGHEALAVKEIRDWDDRGRHTTTGRHLLQLPGGASIIDTPGMRELQLWDAEDGVSATFDDVEAIATQCRFTDCGHESEPDCAVKQALDNGALEVDRWESFQKLSREADFQRRKMDKAEASAHKQMWKRRAMAIRKRSKDVY